MKMMIATKAYPEQSCQYESQKYCSPEQHEILEAEIGLLKMEIVCFFVFFLFFLGLFL